MFAGYVLEKRPRNSPQHVRIIEAPSADDVVTEDEFDKLMTKECAKSDAAKNTPVWCILFGTVTESSGSTGYGPTTTMPTTTTDGK